MANLILGGTYPQDEQLQLEPQLQEEGPEHWQGPIVMVLLVGVRG